MYGRDYQVFNGIVCFQELEKWKCTDPSCGQFCYQHSDTEWTYIQVKETSPLMERAAHEGRNFLKNNNGAIKQGELYTETIDITDYTEEEINEYVAPYGEILEGSEGVARNNLIAECIFEQDIVCGEW